ncbi:MAG: hypothetical protein K2W91_10090, partial [Novosphingobium sp.]|nr:hypothetical protein [Novosphingobium sp.]
MVAIVSGAGLGLQGTSTGAIGASGQLGSASLGRAAQGVTVNAANGNLIIQTQDEFLTGRGPDAAFVSSYNSLGAFGGNYTNLDLSPDADGWLLSTQRKIELVGTANTAGSAAKMTDWDGSIVTFTYNTLSGRYEADEQPYNDDILTWSGDVFTYTEGKSWIVQTFASNIGGRLVSMYDAGRNQYDQPVNLVTFTYDTNTTSGKLTRVTTANSSAGQNGYVDYGYDGSGRLQTLATYFFDGAANQTISRVTYGYDTENRLISVVTDLKLLNSNQPPATYRIDYTYKPYVANDPSSKLITGITQSDGTSLTIDYDGSGRVTKLTQAMDAGITQTTEFTYGPDPSDATKTLTVISINSTTLNYVYKMTADASGRLTRLEEPAPVAGGDATIKTFAYDAYGNVTEALTFDSQASVSNPGLAIEAVRSLYDAASNLLARVNGDRSISFYTYRASNQLLSVTRFADQNPFTSGDFDSDGFVTQAEYDAFLGGTYPASGAMVTRYIYDDSANNGINDDGSTYPGSNPVDVAENHLRFTVSAEGRVTEYRYDDYGQLIATINYGGGAYTGTSWTEAALGTWVAGADKSHAQRVDTAYDFRGNVSTATSYSKTDAA